MKVVVAGYGSIGQRHARILNELGCEVAVVSQRPLQSVRRFAEVRTALSEWRPDYFVVANRTAEHYLTLRTLVECDFGGSVLVEKPLFEKPHPIPPHRFASAGVAYNLRCHPLLTRLKALLEEAEEVVTVNVRVGSFLPNWRPLTDYRRTYSAARAEGGGVLRDLSHELDYVLWLFGLPIRLTAFGGHLSSLEIDSDDVYTILIQTARCPHVSIHMNYLDRVPCREIIANTNANTIRVDLIRNSFSIDGDEVSMSVAPDDTYRAEHQAMMSGNASELCTFEEGLHVLTTISAVENAASMLTWVDR